MSKIDSAASEEKSFENVNGRTHGWMDNGRKVITIAHPEQRSGELKMGDIFFPENRSQHFMQMVYNRDNLHKMANYFKGVACLHADQGVTIYDPSSAT